MRGEFGRGAVELRLVTVGVGNQGARIIGHDQFGNPTDIYQRTAQPG